MSSLRSVLSILIACFVLVQGKNTPENEEWEAYQKQFNKTYNSVKELEKRLEIFHENLQHIKEHNAKFEKGEESYELGLNHLSDMTFDELKQLMMGLVTDNNENTEGALFTASPFVNAEHEVDWRTKNVITPVKDQGACGSCWAFSATGSLESRQAIKTNKLVSLSEQNLVDCDTTSDGCQGGSMITAYRYIKKNRGISTEEAYPYEARDGKCRFKRSDVGATLTNYVRVKGGDENALKQAVAQGPVGVAIQATFKFQLYRRGVFHDDTCSDSSMDLNHGVLIVGYGNENGKDYWLVKNSWGKQWGDNGYIKMVRNNNNMCGIASDAVYPVV